MVLGGEAVEIGLVNRGLAAGWLDAFRRGER